MKINQLDLFSGIGVFHLGFERAGYEVQSYFSEIDQHAIAVYKHQFKDSKYVGAVRDVRGADLPNIDLITFGSPCQDFSLAGRREGMEGERSVLILEAIRLIKECRPRAFVWENVKGTFSSNDGEDFAAILKEFTDIGGYRLEWQLLNTSWFLPQNRERIYLVGYSTTPRGGWRGVFPIGEESRENIRLPRYNTRANTICARYGNDANGSYVSQCELRPQKIIGYTRDVDGKVTDRHLKDEGGTIHTSTGAGGNTDQFVQLDTKYNYKKVNETIEQNPNEFREGEARMMDLHNRKVQDISPCLVEPHHNASAVYDGRPNVKIGTWRTHKDGQGFREVKGGNCPTIPARAREDGSGQPVIENNYRIRRLTPIECERLQGFPDNHTEYGNYDGVIKKMSNTQRYKQCGNAVTVDVVQAVAERMKDIL